MHHEGEMVPQQLSAYVREADLQQDIPPLHRVVAPAGESNQRS